MKPPVSDALLYRHPDTGGYSRNARTRAMYGAYLQQKYKINMLCPVKFQSQLHALASAPTPDGEVLTALNEYFSAFVAINSVHRFPSSDNPGKRCFLVQFENFADAANVSNRCKLRSFAFNGVLVELENYSGNTAHL